MGGVIFTFYILGAVEHDVLCFGYTKANDKGRFRPLLKSPPTDFTEA